MNLVIRHFWYFGFWKKVRESVLKWYNMPFIHRQSRCGCWISPRQGFKAKDVLLNTQKTIPKEYGSKNIPMLLTWATKDYLFGESELNVFKSWFQNHELAYLKESGHFWPEDEGEKAAEYILDWTARKFLKS